MPIIELQRRAVEAGRIKCGEYADGRPQKLDKWRLTSKDVERLEAAAALWGGEVKEWERGEGFELYTDTDTLPVLLLGGQEPTSWFELWSRGGCQRRCDGKHEVMSDSACLCGEDRECKPTTRFSVFLPDLPGIGSWLVSSTGWNAAAELGGLGDLLRNAPKGVFIPARLRLEQRTKIGQGQTHRFAVPVVDIDQSIRELTGQSAAPALGYRPVAAIESGNGVSLEQGLAAAETQEAHRTARSAAPIPEQDIPFGDEPVPVPSEGGVVREVVVDGVNLAGHVATSNHPPDPFEGIETQTDALLPVAECKKKLNALVGQLRDAGHITTEQLYRSMGKDPATIDKSTDATGELHWAPLRDSLDRDELNTLHKRLAGFWVEVQKDAEA